MEDSAFEQKPLIQAHEERTRQTRLQVILTACALAILLAVPASRLDTRELTLDEAVFAQRALGSLENDAQGAAAASLPPAHDALLVSWAILVGTTERPLKLLVIITLVLAALLSGEVACRLVGPWSRAPVYLLFAASPFLNRSDLLQPGLLEALVPALVLGSLMHALGGAVGWLVAGVLGCFLAPFFGGLSALVAAVLSASAFLVSRGLPIRRPRLLAGFFLQWSALAAGLLTCRQLGFETKLAPPTHSGASPSWVLLLPAVSLLPVLVCARFGRRAQWTTALLLLALVGASSSAGRETEPGNLRHALDEARNRRASGGRFVVWGPERMGILFYSRRGHDPALPILAVPEDVEFPALAVLIRHQLRIPTGKAPPNSPPILIYPIPEEAPPGFVIARTGGCVVARLELKEE